MIIHITIFMHKKRGRKRRRTQEGEGRKGGKEECEAEMEEEGTYSPFGRV